MIGDRFASTECLASLIELRSKDSNRRVDDASETLIASDSQARFGQEQRVHQRECRIGEWRKCQTHCLDRQPP